MSKDIIRFTVTLPTDQGFLGRECNNPGCSRYFKVHSDFLKDEMYCPYCAEKFHRNDLLTKDQRDHLRNVAVEKGREFVHNEIADMFKNLARKNSGSKYFKITYKSRPYSARPVTPSYRERKVDSELVCPDCNTHFQVFGIFGYCPGCRTENLRIYDANLEIVKREVASSDDPQRALRHAYTDLVSMFEAFCKNKAKLITAETTRFQMLFETRKFFKKLLNIDILDGLANADLLTLRRVFQKRHAFEHYEGMIEEKYVREIPEDINLLGQKAELTLDEFIVASKAARKVLDTIVRALEGNT